MSGQVRYRREESHDRRIRRGDDFAGDAWRDGKTGRIRYVAVGADPNKPRREREAGRRDAPSP